MSLPAIAKPAGSGSGSGSDATVSRDTTSEVALPPIARPGSSSSSQGVAAAGSLSAGWLSASSDFEVTKLDRSARLDTGVTRHVLDTWVADAKYVMVKEEMCETEDLELIYRWDLEETERMDRKKFFGLFRRSFLTAEANEFYRHELEDRQRVQTEEIDAREAWAWDQHAQSSAILWRETCLHDLDEVAIGEMNGFRVRYFQSHQTLRLRKYVDTLKRQEEDDRSELLEKEAEMLKTLVNWFNHQLQIFKRLATSTILLDRIVTTHEPTHRQLLEHAQANGFTKIEQQLQSSLLHARQQERLSLIQAEQTARQRRLEMPEERGWKELMHEELHQKRILEFGPKYAQLFIEMEELVWVEQIERGEVLILEQRYWQLIIDAFVDDFTNNIKTGQMQARFLIPPPLLEENLGPNGGVDWETGIHFVSNYRQLTFGKSPKKAQPGRFIVYV